MFPHQRRSLCCTRNQQSEKHTMLKRFEMNPKFSFFWEITSVWHQGEPWINGLNTGKYCASELLIPGDQGQNRGKTPNPFPASFPLPFHIPQLKPCPGKRLKKEKQSHWTPRQIMEREEINPESAAGTGRRRQILK